MSEETSPYEHIRKRVEKRYERRKSFISDFGMMVLSAGVLGGLWLTTDPSARVSPIVILVIVGGLGLGSFEKLVSFIMGELSDRAVEREIEREREFQREIGGKAKRDEERYVRLSADGELIDIDDYEDPAEVSKRSG